MESVVGDTFLTASTCFVVIVVTQDCMPTGITLRILIFSCLHRALLECGVVDISDIWAGFVTRYDGWMVVLDACETEGSCENVAIWFVTI